MKLAEDEAAVLAAEAEALADALGAERSADYQRVAVAAHAGELTDDVFEAAGAVAAVALETGRAKAVHGPAGVRALVALWKRSPQGRSVAAELDDVNTALSPLRGLPVQDVRVAATSPGSYAVTLSAGEYEVRLAVDRDGVRLRSLNVGGGGIGE